MTAPGSATPDAEAWVPVTGDYDLGASLAELRRGPWDPTSRVGSGRAVLAWTLPAGAVTVELLVEPGGLRVRAWGPAAARVASDASTLVGEPLVLSSEPDAESLPPGPATDVLRRLHRRLPGLRLPRTGAVFDALIPAVIEQKVTGVEAWRSWRRLVGAFGSPAPGPHGLRLGPLPSVLADLPYHAFHRFGIERRRADTLRRACAAGTRLSVLADAAPEVAAARLSSLPGVGLWTTAEVLRRSHGWADAVSVGDYHHAREICFAFEGVRDGTDERMLELLEPFRPQRGLVVRLVEAAGVGPGRRAPRARLRRIEDI